MGANSTTLLNSITEPTNADRRPLATEDGIGEEAIPTEKEKLTHERATQDRVTHTLDMLLNEAPVHSNTGEPQLSKEQVVTTSTKIETNDLPKNVQQDLSRGVETCSRKLEIEQTPAEVSLVTSALDGQKPNGTVSGSVLADIMGCPAGHNKWVYHITEGQTHLSASCCDICMASTPVGGMMEACVRCQWKVCSSCKESIEPGSTSTMPLNDMEPSGDAHAVNFEKVDLDELLVQAETVAEIDVTTPASPPTRDATSKDERLELREAMAKLDAASDSHARKLRKMSKGLSGPDASRHGSVEIAPESNSFIMEGPLLKVFDFLEPPTPGLHMVRESETQVADVPGYYASSTLKSVLGITRKIERRLPRFGNRRPSRRDQLRKRLRTRISEEPAVALTIDSEVTDSAPRSTLAQPSSITPANGGTMSAQKAKQVGENMMKALKQSIKALNPMFKQNDAAYHSSADSKPSELIHWHAEETQKRVEELKAMECSSDDLQKFIETTEVTENAMSVLYKLELRINEWRLTEDRVIGRPEVARLRMSARKRLRTELEQRTAAVRHALQAEDSLVADLGIKPIGNDYLEAHFSIYATETASGKQKTADAVQACGGESGSKKKKRRRKRKKKKKAKNTPDAPFIMNHDYCPPKAEQSSSPTPGITPDASSELPGNPLALKTPRTPNESASSLPSLSPTSDDHDSSSIDPTTMSLFLNVQDENEHTSPDHDHKTQATITKVKTEPSIDRYNHISASLKVLDMQLEDANISQIYQDMQGPHTPRAGDESQRRELIEWKTMEKKEIDTICACMDELTAETVEAMKTIPVELERVERYARMGERKIALIQSYRDMQKALSLNADKPIADPSPANDTTSPSGMDDPNATATSPETQIAGQEQHLQLLDVGSSTVKSKPQRKVIWSEIDVSPNLVPFSPDLTGLPSPMPTPAMLAKSPPLSSSLVSSCELEDVAKLGQSAPQRANTPEELELESKKTTDTGNGETPGSPRAGSPGKAYQGFVSPAPLHKITELVLSRSSHVTAGTVSSDDESDDTGTRCPVARSLPAAIPQSITTETSGWVSSDDDGWTVVKENNSKKSKQKAKKANPNTPKSGGRTPGGSGEQAPKKKRRGRRGGRRQREKRERAKERARQEREKRLAEERKNRRPGDWDCPNCGYMLYADKTECIKCKTPKPDSCDETDQESAPFAKRVQDNFARAERNTAENGGTGKKRRRKRGGRNRRRGNSRSTPRASTTMADWIETVVPLPKLKQAKQNQGAGGAASKSGKGSAQGRTPVNSMPKTPSNCWTHGSISPGRSCDWVNKAKGISRTSSSTSSGNASPSRAKRKRAPAMRRPSDFCHWGGPRPLNSPRFERPPADMQPGTGTRRQHRPLQNMAHGNFSPGATSSHNQTLPHSRKGRKNAWGAIAKPQSPLNLAEILKQAEASLKRSQDKASREDTKRVAKQKAKQPRPSVKRTPSPTILQTAISIKKSTDSFQSDTTSTSMTQNSAPSSTQDESPPQRPTNGEPDVFSRFDELFPAPNKPIKETPSKQVDPIRPPPPIAPPDTVGAAAPAKIIIPLGNYKSPASKLINQSTTPIIPTHIAARMDEAAPIRFPGYIKTITESHSIINSDHFPGLDILLLNDQWTQSRCLTTPRRMEGVEFRVIPSAAPQLAPLQATDLVRFAQTPQSVALVQPTTIYKQIFKFLLQMGWTDIFWIRKFLLRKFGCFVGTVEDLAMSESLSTFLNRQELFQVQETTGSWLVRIDPDAGAKLTTPLSEDASQWCPVEGTPCDVESTGSQATFEGEPGSGGRRSQKPVTEKEPCTVEVQANANDAAMDVDQGQELLMPGAEGIPPLDTAKAREAYGKHLFKQMVLPKLHELPTKEFTWDEVKDLMKDMMGYQAWRKIRESKTHRIIKQQLMKYNRAW